MKYQHLFGPVPSRRLGISLGIDLVPYKTCTLNCVYCECGETTDLTVDLQEYIPVQSVIDELAHCLSAGPLLDYITFSGSGEPTLNRGIGRVVDYLKKNYPQYKVCLLTNGTLFGEYSIRSAVSKIDLIIPSLDAASEEIFKKINRPHKSISCAAVIDGLARLRSEYCGEIVLEIFIVPGFNDSPEELSLLKKALKKIKPARVQIGTLDRPGTEDWVKRADAKIMEDISMFLGNAAPIGDFQPGPINTSFSDKQGGQIIRMLKRRPCTLHDLQQVLNLRPVEVQKRINYLLKQKKIEAEQKERGIFFKIKNH